MVGRERRAQDKYPQELGSLRMRLATPYPPATEDYITKIFAQGQSSGSMLDHRQFAHFEAIERGGWMLPIVSVEFDFANDPAVCAVRLGLFLLRQFQDDQAVHHAVGFRFEMSEGPNSIHCYPHAQLITAWGLGGKDWMNLPTPNWLPISYPALPLDVRTPLGLVIAMFVSLYGGTFWRALSGADFAGQLPPYLEGERFLSTLSEQASAQ